MILAEYVKRINPSFNRMLPEIEVTSIEQDHRLVHKGSIFVCIEGNRIDGHTFASEAVKKGAIALVAQKPIQVDVPVIYVDDTTHALAKLTSTFYGYPSEKLTMIGVTGTNGKTTITHFIEQIVKSVGKKTGLLGTMYNRILDEKIPTVNTTLASNQLQHLLSEMVNRGVEVVSMEVSSHALVTNRVECVDFDVAVFSNISQDHLDFHHTMENYINAKKRLFSKLNDQNPETKYAVINVDDPHAAQFIQATSATIITYGIHRDAIFRATSITLDERGSSFTLEFESQTFQIQAPVIGLFNVYNLLAAIAASYVIGIPLEKICAEVSKILSVPGRMEHIDVGQDFTVLVDYAHTPDGLENVLHTLRSLSSARLSIVVGCGGDRDRVKRPLMGKVSCAYASHVLFTSDNPRSENPQDIVNEMIAGLEENSYEIILDRKEAIEKAILSASPNDIVVIAGKGHETIQIIGDKHYPFDDRIVAREAILKKIHRS